MQTVDFTLPYPAIVTGDWHIHSRLGQNRQKELAELSSIIKDMQSKHPVPSLVICGDLLDRNAAIQVTDILQLADVFGTFECVVLLMGNHDTPVRGTSLTQLDVFSLIPQVHIVNTFSVGKCVYNENVNSRKIEEAVCYLPYYTATEKVRELCGKTASSDRFNAVFAHRDIFELNSYADKDFAQSMTDFPPTLFVFNGHLHCAAVHAVRLMSKDAAVDAGYYQLGSPYPTSWSDDCDKNQWMWVYNGTSVTPTRSLCITVDADKDYADTAKFKRTRETSEKSAAVSVDNIKNIMADIDETDITLDRALYGLEISVPAKRIIRSVVGRAAGGIEGVRL